MTTQLITYTLAQRVEPTEMASMYQITYTKNNADDTLDVKTYTPIKTIWYVLPYDDSAGAIDLFTWSGTIITFAGTGALTGTGSMIVVGTC